MTCKLYMIPALRCLGILRMRKSTLPKRRIEDAMRGLHVALLITLGNSSAFGFSERIDMKLGCKTNPRIVDTCIAVRGRLSTYNGNPTLRLWPIGTHHILGIIQDEEHLSVPEDIRSVVGFRRDLYGDFQVCPFTKPKPAHMQYICVEAASNVRVKYRR